MHSPIAQRIASLKQQRQALILAHNYQRGEIQDIADFVGDSLELSRQAAATDAKVIVFCGVHFMAETAKILSPDKTVLLPDLGAGCPMADMITPEQLAAEKAKHPGAQVVCYVNSSAAVKALCDVCCTSANGVKVVQAMDPARPVIFAPDQYLGHFAQLQSGRELILWPGFCPTHMKITVERIAALRTQHPGAPVLVHPECRPDVVAAADQALSTGGILRYARSYAGQTLIVGTETGILHRLAKENPAKTFIPVNDKAVCPNMKRITLEKVLASLETMQHPIEVPEDIRQKALASVERMLAL
ncbi:MAG: quinolinate synthase NadA [Pseudomonadota bacterium]